MFQARSDSLSLNPFEVREVLQAIVNEEADTIEGLNPFEVREVLQVVV